MKRLWLHSVRAYLRLGLFFYFRRIHVHGVKNIPIDKPILLLSNHQNALLDALLIGTKSERLFFFLTRAAVFKKSLVSTILKSLQMLPVYRIRDGWSNITNNNAIFETCSELLKNNEAIVIFPEGSHNLERRVRPLSKGFTRIVFDTIEKHPEIDLRLIPVGLNFVSAKECPDSVALYFGNPISAKDFRTGHKNDDVVNLKSTVHREISKLSTHIATENYGEIVEKLDALKVNYLDPTSVNECIANNFESCAVQPKSNMNSLRYVLKITLILNLLLPYIIWKVFVKPKIKELEFTSTFRFAIAITLVPIYLLAIVFVLSTLVSLKVALIYVISVLLLSLLTIKL